MDFLGFSPFAVFQSLTRTLQRAAAAIPAAARIPRLLLELGGAAGIALAMLSQEAPGQVPRDSSVDWLVSANSDGEAYLRAVQLVGGAPLYPWSLRGFSTGELRHLTSPDSTNPWDASFGLRGRKARFAFITPNGGLIYNSRIPYGSNDGPLWAGRGVTSSLTMGARVTVGPLDVVLAPQFFRAENADFPIVPTGLKNNASFANAGYTFSIDLPQRFGSRPYQRLDPGQSTLRLSLGGLTAGASTANEFWGPAVGEPFLLSNNAAGFAHLFFGTAHPVGLGGVAVHFRMIAGKLEQSEYTPISNPGRGRYLSGLVAVVTLRQLPGFEIGGGRLFHNYFPDSTVTLSRVIEPILHGLLKKQRATALGTTTGDEPDNQLASLFARWVFPESGVEVYGEYGRDDSAFDQRDLVLEPDHDVAVIMGFRKGWKRPRGRIVVLSGEIFNDRLAHLYPVRIQEVPYVHGSVLQGHTQRGQILGAADLIGGGGESVTLESYSPVGHSLLRYTRASQAQQYFAQRQAGWSPFDIVHALEYEQTAFHRRIDVTSGIAGVYDMNRNLSGSDVFNVRVTSRIIAHW